MLAIQFSCLIGLLSRYTVHATEKIELLTETCPPPQHSRASDSIYTLQPVIEAQYVKKKGDEEGHLVEEGRALHPQCCAVQSLGRWSKGLCFRHATCAQPTLCHAYDMFMRGSCHVSIQLYSDTILVTRIEIAAVGHLGWW